MVGNIKKKIVLTSAKSHKAHMMLFHSPQNTINTMHNYFYSIFMHMLVFDRTIFLMFCCYIYVYSKIIPHKVTHKLTNK